MCYHDIRYYCAKSCSLLSLSSHCDTSLSNHCDTISVSHRALCFDSRCFGHSLKSVGLDKWWNRLPAWTCSSSNIAAALGTSTGFRLQLKYKAVQAKLGTKELQLDSLPWMQLLILANSLLDLTQFLSFYLGFLEQLKKSKLLFDYLRQSSWINYQIIPKNDQQAKELESWHHFLSEIREKQVKNSGIA